MRKILFFFLFLLLAGGAAAETYKLKYSVRRPAVSSVVGTSTQNVGCSEMKAPCIGTPCGSNTECINQKDAQGRYTGHYACRCLPGYFGTMGKNCT